MNNETNLDTSAGFIRELQIMDQAKNYNQWIFDSIKPYIGSRVLEVGCGIGTFSEKILETGASVTSIDVDERCVMQVEKRIKNQRLRTIAMPAERIENLGELFDTVVLLNVLEHIEDDSRLIKQLSAVLNGNLIIFVPAFQILFGKTDFLVGHYRRYTKASLLSIIRSAGLEIVTCSYFNSVGFFAWFLMNRVLSQKTKNPSSVQVYDRVFVPVVRLLERVIPPPFGQSVLLVANRSGTVPTQI